MSFRRQKIRFFNNDLRFSFSQRTQFKAFLERILRLEGKELDSINYVFCNDQEIRKLNRQYLNHDYYTDILTFDLSISKKIVAEIFISVPRVKNNSIILNQPFNKELHRVMIHGILHLCGYRDKTPTETRKMRELENKYLKLYSHRFM